MKLSQMPTAQATNALVRIVDPFSRIAEDEETAKSFSEISESIQGVPVITAYAKAAKKLFPLFLGKHRRDIFDILSIVTGKSCEDIGRQTFLDTLKDFDDLLKDAELLSFFHSFAGMEKQKTREMK